MLFFKYKGKKSVPITKKYKFKILKSYDDIVKKNKKGNEIIDLKYFAKKGIDFDYPDMVIETINRIEKNIYATYDTPLVDDYYDEILAQFLGFKYLVPYDIHCVRYIRDNCLYVSRGEPNPQKCFDENYKKTSMRYLKEKIYFLDMSNRKNGGELYGYKNLVVLNCSNSDYTEVSDYKKRIESINFNFNKKAREYLSGYPNISELICARSSCRGMIEDERNTLKYLDISFSYSHPEKILIGYTNLANLKIYISNCLGTDNEKCVVDKVPETEYFEDGEYSFFNCKYPEEEIICKVGKSLYLNNFLHGSTYESVIIFDKKTKKIIDEKRYKIFNKYKFMGAGELDIYKSFDTYYQINSLYKPHYSCNSYENKAIKRSGNYNIFKSIDVLRTCGKLTELMEWYFEKLFFEDTKRLKNLNKNYNTLLKEYYNPDMKKSHEEIVIGILNNDDLVSFAPRSKYFIDKSSKKISEIYKKNNIKEKESITSFCKYCEIGNSEMIDKCISDGIDLKNAYSYEHNIYKSMGIEEDTDIISGGSWGPTYVKYTTKKTVWTDKSRLYSQKMKSYSEEYWKKFH